ncbi:uncharacterized protein RDI95_000294 isoform 1-T1 [Morus bassanus]
MMCRHFLRAMSGAQQMTEKTHGTKEIPSLRYREQLVIAAAAEVGSKSGNSKKCICNPSKDLRKVAVSSHPKYCNCSLDLREARYFICSDELISTTVCESRK